MSSTVPVILGLVLCVGCSDGGGDGEEVVDCAKETSQDNFVIGLEKVGVAGKLDFKLMATDPSPQFAGDNTWTILISTMTGGSVAGPLTGATMSVTPYMPDHQHVSIVTPVITPLTDAGQYKLERVNTWMPGLWETTIKVNGTDGDQVVFKTCIPS
jgi:hypothetical protein